MNIENIVKRAERALARAESKLSQPSIHIITREEELPTKSGLVVILAVSSLADLETPEPEQGIAA